MILTANTNINLIAESTKLLEENISKIFTTLGYSMPTYEKEAKKKNLSSIKCRRTLPKQ